jgi:hypothetical protein
MSNKNFQSEENEILTGDDRKVQQMLGGLKRVEAPKDFDFRLKARIKSADPDKLKRGWFPLLRYAAPLALAVVVLAVLAANGLYSTDGNAVQVVERADRNPVENVDQPGVPQPKETTVAVSVSPAPVVENPPANSQTTNKKDLPALPKEPELAANAEKHKNDKPQIDNNGGGSRDDAQKNANVLLPKGIGRNNSVQVKDVLSIIGIDADFSGSQWRVRSVGENSIAGNAGVKAGDVITAFDGNSLAGETIPSSKTINGNLTIVRGGEKMEIKLQNK